MIPLLRKGQRFTMAGQSYTVEYVNASRAHCTTKVPTTVKGRTFQRRESIDVSPNTCVELLADVTRKAGR